MFVSPEDNMKTSIDEEFLVRITQEMIQIPTINPPGEGYHKFVDFSANILNEIGMDVEVLNYKSKYPIVYAHINKGQHPEIHFNGHYDVVPIQGEWTVSPFGGTIKDNKIFGRGASDMKGGIACFISAIASIIKLKKNFQGCISVSLVPDEETGGKFGSGLFVETLRQKPDVVIIPEPSFPRILLGHKGVVQVYIEALGKTSHAAMPTNGKNAFERIVFLANSLLKKWAVKDGIINSDIRNKYPKKADTLLLPTITIGGIASSGNAINSVPEKARFSLDRRFLPYEKAEEVLVEIKKFVKNHGEDFRVIEILSAESSISPRRMALPILYPLQNAITQINGSPAPETISAGFDDTRFFREKWSIPCITYGPGYSGTAHILDEYVDIQRLIDVSTIFLHFIEEFVSVPRNT